MANGPSMSVGRFVSFSSWELSYCSGCRLCAASRSNSPPANRRRRGDSVKQVLGTPVTDYLPALGLLVITILYLATAYNYSPDARAVPAGVAWVMLVLVILDLVSRTQIGRASCRERV